MSKQVFCFLVVWLTRNAAVRTLDNNLKTLVYENYNKFISATETIASMKSNVERMDTDMQVLSQKMALIDTICSNVDAKMAPRRDKIDELSSVYRLLKGRQFLFELPNRLRNNLEQGQYAEAVKYYLLTMDVLKSYEHLPSFGSINEECKATMAELRGKLWERVNSASTLPAAFAEAVGLLVDLQSDQAKLRQLFAAHAEARFQEALKKEADEVSMLSGNVLPVVVSIGAHFMACFVERPVLTSTEAADAKKELMGTLDRFVDLYYVEAQRLLSETSDVGEVVAGITNMSDSLCEAMAKLPLRFGEQKVSDLVNASIRAYIKRDLALVQEETRSALDATLAPIPPEISVLQVCTKASNAICRSISSFLDNLQPMVDPKWTIGRDPLSVVRQIAVKLAGLFTGVASHALGVPSKEHMLLMSGLCVLLEQHAVPMAKEGLAGLAVLSQSHPSAIDPQFRASELVSILHSAANTLLQGYLTSCSSRLAKLMTRSIDAGNWMSSELASVRRPRLVVSVLVEDLTSLHNVMNELFASSNKPTAATAVASATGSAPSRANSALPKPASSYGISTDEMRVLFNERVRVYTPAEFSSSSVVFCVSKVLVKSWIENIRTRVLCKNALHQMQVDAYVLKTALGKMLSGEQLRSVESLLEQVERSSEDRCVEPVPLEQSVLKQIAQSASQEVLPK